jgi:hypothetical protein
VWNLSTSDLRLTSVASFKAKTDILTQESDSASDDYAISLTDVACSKVGHGGEEYVSILLPVLQEI